MQIDDEEASHAAACPSGPQQRRSPALFQTSCSKVTSTNHAGDHADPTRHPLDLRISGARKDRPDPNDVDTPRWLRTLRNEFDIHSFVECAEEGQTAYIDTWYVSHSHAPRCSASRPIKLTGDPSTWQDLILAAWDDMRDHHEPFALHVVKPTPPSTQMESTLLHVILEQHCPVLTHAAGIISVIRIDRHHAALTHVALSIARLIPTRNIAWHVHLQDLCVLRQCKVFRGREPLPADAIEKLDSGFGIVIFVPPLSESQEPIEFNHDLLLWNQGTAAHMNASDAALNDIDEESGFMQVTQHNQQREMRSHETGIAVTCKTGEPDNHNDIPVTSPSGELPARPRPRHDGQTDWISDLWEIFQAHGEWDVWDEQSYVSVSTWFIHHGRHVVCRRPRTLRLVGAPITWIPDLRAGWLDLMDIRRPFSIHIVNPRPPQFRSAGIVCHVLLEQQSNANSAAIVLTALLEGPNRDGIIQSAYSTARQVNRQSLISTLEIDSHCVSRQCFVVHGLETTHDDTWFAVESVESCSVSCNSFDRR